jgi:hypothetical protein
LLRSVAEVKQLWSKKHVNSNQQKLTQPIQVEAQLFLKINLSYWDVFLIQEALQELNMM